MPQPSLRPTLVALFGFLALCGLAAAKDHSARVTGRILDEHGAPVVGGNVLLENDNERASAESAADGGFELRVEDARESFRIRVEKPGHEVLEDVLDLEPGTIKKISLTLPTTAKRELAEAYNGAVESLFANDHQAARGGFTRALELDPNLAPAILALARLDLADGNALVAARGFERYLELEEAEASVLSALYEAYRGAGESAAADALVERLVGTDEGAALAAKGHNEGVRLFQEGDRAAAKREFEAASQLRPDLVPTLSTLAALYYNDGEYAEAAAAADRLLAIEPQNESGLKIRYLAYDGLGDEAKAAAAFDGFVAALPDLGADLLVDHAIERFETSDLVGARRLLERALAVRPDHPRAHYQLGLCYASQGDTSQARRELERFLELAPDDPEAAAARDMLQYYQ